jgi:thioesterase domain-containing protein
MTQAIDKIQLIQAYLYEHIPLSQAMQVSVVEASDFCVVLSAPLQPNINHRETVFGGSASALSILSAWTLINFRLKNECINARLVIQSNTMKYEKPIDRDFKAICTLEDSEAWLRFIAIFNKKKRSRLKIRSLLTCNGQIVGEFEGSFVALN